MWSDDEEQGALSFTPMIRGGAGAGYGRGVAVGRYVSMSAVYDTGLCSK
jgi:hypothetical protein